MLCLLFRHDTADRMAQDRHLRQCETVETGSMLLLIYMCKVCNQHFLASALLVVLDFVLACICSHLNFFVLHCYKKSYVSPYCSYVVPLCQSAVTSN